MYIPRKITALPLLSFENWKWKRYYISVGGRPFDDALVNACTSTLTRLLGSKVAAEHQVGFSVIHAGADADFIVQGYWENTNELSVRVFKTSPGEASRIEPADANQSTIACVWDLAVIGHERMAWIKYVLSSDRPEIEHYLQDTLEGMH